MRGIHVHVDPLKWHSTVIALSVALPSTSFKNRPPLGFDELAGEPDQALQLSRDSSRDSIEYPVKATRFNGVTSLLMHFPSNFGAETTKIYYIGLRGEFTQVRDLLYM